MPTRSRRTRADLAGASLRGGGLGRPAARAAVGRFLQARVNAGAIARAGQQRLGRLGRPLRRIACELVVVREVLLELGQALLVRVELLVPVLAALLEPLREVVLVYLARLG